MPIYECISGGMNMQNQKIAYELVRDYKNDHSLRRSFNALAKKTFGIDFESWYQKGYWNDAYICYSYVSNNQVVANVSVNQLTLKWEGQTYQALQIGTVMTDPEYRRQGLANQLLDTVMKEWESKVDFIYLFGNDLALPLYMQFDMKPYEEHSFYADLSVKQAQAAGRLRKLDLADTCDKALVETLVQNRVAQTEGIGVEDDSHLLMFYCHEAFADQLYYAEEQNAILVMKEKEDILHVFEVISDQKQELDVLLEQVGNSDIKRVNFHFKPVYTSLNICSAPLDIEDQTLLIRGLKKAPTAPFRFPLFSHA